MLVDTHCHLDFPDFKEDLNQVIQRAKDKGIAYIINIGSSLKGSQDALALAKQYDFIYATVGLHPHEADRIEKTTIERLTELAKEEKVVAIGETGLDYFLPAGRQGKNYSKKENQRPLFQALVGIAKDLGLPLVIHNRDAEGDTLAILKEAMPVRAVVHCFSGDDTFLKECLDLGLLISFTCNITYPAKPFNSGRDPAGENKMVQRDKKPKNLRELVRITPIERLMLETDAPFLSPEGFRGKRNEPMQVKILAEEVARIKAMDVEEVARVTTDNARKFFNLK